MLTLLNREIIYVVTWTECIRRLSIHVFFVLVPMVLKCCAEFIESHGIVDGIYRLSGVTSNIQKLR
jgi:hypothetical protein